MELTNNDFTRLKNYMYNNYGINLEKKRTLIETRLALVVRRLGFESFKDYTDSLMKDKTGEYASVLVEKLTTNFTYFMREEMHYDFLRDQVFIPGLKKTPIGGLKIWSAASSTGEEAYCIAMLASSVFGRSAKLKVSILASDISSGVLKHAKTGIYSNDKISKLPQLWVKNYFKQLNDSSYVVVDDIKNLVEFKYFNLNDNLGWYNGKYDVIFCRNVMIYFDNPTKQKLSQKLYESLKPGGYLIIGMSENLSNLQTDFERVKPSVYRKRL
ncbi:CheR family methyltransferase [Asaccharospora irregularis]|uniref:protein-glutamate O-methyltransferase n=1 Tax=Asaccharospora irregularis DSM 2635 TaxID=1121321 RepID=A0A1M5NEW1_9FIRM|nr:protein-glutamate O-methyltransferase CheR [Asaccharospora irregularis]SHG88114.1 MCP methyltransferase, CheR-type [Asaccharospora irregularis DSM 2635]